MAQAPRRPHESLLVAWIAALVVAAAPPPERSAAEFLADKPAELAVIARITDIETRWVIIDHGDHLPVLRVQSTVVRPILGTAVEAGERLAMMHVDYSDMIFEEISAPPVLGHEYLLLADAAPAAGAEWLDPVEVDWLAHAQGAHRLRGSEGAEFIFWQGQRHSLAELEGLLEARTQIPLELIGDPDTRLRVAQQRLGANQLGDPAEFVRGVSTLVRSSADGQDMVPFEQWYEGLSLLRRLGQREEHQELVVAGLRPLLAGGDDHQRLVVALLLAELGDASGRPALEAALQAGDVELNSDPDSGLSLPGRLPYDDSSIAAAAHALGALGGNQGLSHPDNEVRLAAAEGLADRGGDELKAALRSMVRELDREVRALEEKGELAAVRQPGDHRQRYPHQWVKAHQLLARLGDDDSLEKLVLANQTDWQTYPEAETAVHPRLQAGTWSWAPHQWPDLRQALASADRDPDRLLARLASLYGKPADWQDPVLLSVRGWVRGEPADEAPAPAAGDRPEILRRIAGLLSSEVAQERAEGLAGAGYQRLEEHYDEVLEAALEGTGVERRGAIYGLGFYRREPAEAHLRRLCREGSLSSRVGGLELATRRRPERFAAEAIEILAELSAPQEAGGEAAMDEFERESVTRQFPRLLARFTRGSIPAPILAALASGSQAQRLAMAVALGLGGNPAAAPELKVAAEDADGKLAQAARWALERLGPEE